MIIKRKQYSTAVLVGNDIMNGAHAALPTASTSAFATLPKTVDANNIKAMKAAGSANRVGSIEGVRNLAGKEVFTKTPKVVSGKQAFQLGRNSVGLKQGAMNTWGKMGKAGKAGTIAAGAGAAYLMGKGLFGGKKKD